MKILCKVMGINRSSFYYWKKHLGDPAPRTRNLIDNIQLFTEYHLKYPSHGYRWLNAKIHLDTGAAFSEPYAHKCCKIAGIKSRAKHYRYKKPGDPFLFCYIEIYFIPSLPHHIAVSYVHRTVPTEFHRMHPDVPLQLF